MSVLRDKLREALGVKAQPTDAELDRVIADVKSIRETKAVTNADWMSLIGQNVRVAGNYEEKGRDYSNLNALLDQLLASQQDPPQSQSQR